ncbi:phosphoribosylamine--glycine ligase [Candidatus Peregrinibacteria bacterium]|jgi:phosphoribosylamine---glycine ligase|nr:phosphoribosylamine--glycine ligase [Candidatus Peregrinibacteria bacterium]MBT4631985.1 phosphoribosylamine--glycine ligase [Candidatus Peregrinibacteria bacterium]
MKTLIVGNGGRESALAERMSESSKVSAVMGHMNPSIADVVEKTGGLIKIGKVTDPNLVTDFAEENGIDLVMVSADSPLEAGVVDALLKKGIATVGPDREGARIEWDKAFSRELIQEAAPEANPVHRIARSREEVLEVFREFGDAPVAVKPRGLTGGKGVKVVGPHLRDNDNAKNFALSLIQEGGSDPAVIIEEKIEGVEFTLQAITDGRTVAFPPASYDYPYRFEGDKGPGTGGMGAYTMRERALPFMTPEEYEKICSISRSVVTHLHEKGLRFSGVLNGGFFITPRGEVRVIEFNARFGDPECMNIMSLVEQDWVDVMGKLASGTLQEGDITFRDTATSLNYLVTPEYALGGSPGHNFSINRNAIESAGVQIHFSACERTKGDHYRTVGNSRVMALLAHGQTPVDAREKIIEAIASHVSGPLQHRTDIASEQNIRHISSLIGR